MRQWEALLPPEWTACADTALRAAFASLRPELAIMLMRACLARKFPVDPRGPAFARFTDQYGKPVLET